MVIRYAVGEKHVLEEKHQKEYFEKKYKEALHENEILQNRVQKMGSEKSRICQMLDDKVKKFKNQ